MQEDWSCEPALSKVLAPGAADLATATDSQSRLLSFIEDLVAAANASEEIERKAQEAAAAAAAAAPAQAKAVLVGGVAAAESAPAGAAEADFASLETRARQMWSLAQVVAMTSLPNMG